MKFRLISPCLDVAKKTHLPVKGVYLPQDKCEIKFGEMLIHNHSPTKKVRQQKHMNLQLNLPTQPPWGQKKVAIVGEVAVIDCLPKK